MLNMTFFFNFSLTLIHLHSLQVKNCNSNSGLVVNEDDSGKFRLERFKSTVVMCIFIYITTDKFCFFVDTILPG